MRLLVTGIHGFIGGSVARFARSLGHEVIGLARSGSQGRRVDCDVLPVGDQRHVTEIIDTFDPQGIVHAAGTASVPASIKDPRRDFDGSVLTWLDLLEAVRQSTRRPLLLLPSSAAVYGAPDSLPVAENAPLRPVSPYGFHKRASELLAEEYASCFAMEVVVLRLFSVFGPGQRRLLVWELFDQLTSAAEQVRLQGTGLERRDFLHVDDVVEAIVGILAKRLDDPTKGGKLEILNLGSGEDISVLEIAELMRALVGSTKQIVCQGIQRPGDPGAWRADVSRLRHRLAPWSPRSARLTLPTCIAAWRSQCD
jgi:UDP-glucose 4-epimerase